jgi:hypothetical protein
VRNSQLRLLSLAFALAGLRLFYYKAAVLGLPLRPRERTSVWTVEARVRFKAEGGPARVSLRVPDSARLPGDRRELRLLGYGSRARAARAARALGEAARVGRRRSTTAP